MIAAGKYRGVAVRAALGKTSTGKEQVAVEFALTDPPGETMTWYGYFTDATFDRTIDSLRACGWSSNMLTDFTAGNPLPDGMDKEVELVVEIEDDLHGVPRAKVRWVNSGGGLAMKSALSADEAKSFAARMKGRVLAADKARGTAPAPAAQGKKTTVGSADADDLGF